MKLAPAHGQKILARADVDAGLRERRAQRGVPVLAVVDAREAVATAVNVVVCAEQSAADALHVGLLAAAHEDVPGGQFAEHLLEEVVEIVAARDVLKVRLVLRLCGLEVEAVVVRVVEEVALDAPDLAVHLPPLGARVNLHGQVV